MSLDRTGAALDLLKSTLRSAPALSEARREEARIYTLLGRRDLAERVSVSVAKEAPGPSVLLARAESAVLEGRQVGVAAVS